jgi:hypothetical protein
VLAELALKPRLAGLGIEIPPTEMLAPEPLRTLQAEIEKWVPIIKAAKIKGE